MLLASLIGAANQDTPQNRLILAGVAIFVGLSLVVVGWINIKSGHAGDKGWQFEGKSAVNLGWLRVVLGTAVIIFGIVFPFVGPFMK